MFKIFNVSEKKEQDDNSIDVEIREDDLVEEDIGQVALDIIDLEDSIIIVAPLAGIAMDDVDISISKNILTVSGERNRPMFYNDSEKILVEECFFGPFSRSIIMPENLAFNKIRATMENNLLAIEVPKLQFNSKTIKINKLEG
ncbi:MAG: Hsp20/alpha crystallin family protein [Candidatus Gracilibacteria bacterium]|nr:Hsp20/alpha crystallin family protein [Candidatus Gracilibacteria bacterium]